MRRIFLTTCWLSLSACSTFSFSPPHVDLHQKMTGASLKADCTLTQGTGAELPENVAGARALIRNYFDAYECAMRVSANGRQAFEIPAFLALAGTTTAVALGAGPNVAIAGGAGNSIFSAGKNYYDPRQQTAILGDAIDALSCLQSEAIGISPTVIEAVSEQQADRGFRSASTGGGTVQVTVEVQYFDMIYAKLANIHAIATDRLATRGNLNAGSVASEIELLANKVREAEEAKRKAKEDPPTTITALSDEKAQLVQDAQSVQLDLNVLEPKLAKCVVRAKA